MHQGAQLILLVAQLIVEPECLQIQDEDVCQGNGELFKSLLEAGWPVIAGCEINA